MTELIGVHYATILPLASFIMALAALASAPIDKGVHARLLRLALIALIAGWPIYMLAFAVLDYSLKEVAENTSEGLSLYLRLGASWSGGGSSLLLFAALTALFTLVQHRGDWSPGFTIPLNIVVVAALLAAVSNGALATIDDAGGRGLNPLLKSPWTIPHPLATFIGYAALLVSGLLAASGGYNRRLTLIGFTMLTLGIILGAAWSYETFGWGGYWAWDPVEIAELAVWLAGLAMIHSLGSLAPARRAAGALTVSSVMLALFVTRSGVSPLHSFAAESMGSVILLASAVLFLALFSYNMAGAADAVIDSIRRALSRRNVEELSLIAASTAIWASTVYVYSSLLFPSIAIAAGLEVELPTMETGAGFYHPVLYPAALATVLAAPGYFMKHVNWRAYMVLVLSGVMVAVALIVAYLEGRIEPVPGGSTVLNIAVLAGLALSSISMASIAVAALAGAYRRLKRGGRVRSIIVDLGLGMLHVGFLVMFVGVLLSWHVAFHTSYFQDARITLDGEASISGITISVEEYDYERAPSSVDLYSHFTGVTVTAYNAWLALDMVSRDVTPVVQEILLAGPEDGGGPEAILVKAVLRGLETPSSTLVVEGIGEVYIVDVRSGVEREVADGNITLILEDFEASVWDRPLVEDETLQGAVLTLGITASQASIGTVFEDQDYTIDQHGVYRIVFDEPATITLQVGGEPVEIGLKTLEIYPNASSQWISKPTSQGVAVNSPITIVADATLEATSGSLRLPYTVDAGLYLYILVERGEAIVLEEIIESELSRLLIHELQEAYNPEKPAYIALPREAPESVTLTLEMTIDGEPVEASIRFDVTGEAMGIHGLVIDVVLVDRGLSDLYISVEPPIVEGYFNAYHEPLIEYIKLAQETLKPKEYLALLALLAAGYTMGAQPASQQQAAMIQEALLDMHLLAVNHNTGDGLRAEGLRVAVKLVPGVDLIWIGAGMAVASGIVMVSMLSNRRGG